MSQEPLERWLREHRAPLLRDLPPVDEAHVDDERLALGGAGLTESERSHLAHCSECRAVLAEVGALQPTPPARRAAWLPVFVGLLAAAAGLALWLYQPEDFSRDSGTYTARGADAALSAEVVVLATDAAGARRVLAPGATVHPTDRLGFVYGNPAGTHRSLVILGFDGDRVHWYYPERPGDPPVALTSERSVRLPFDVGLEDHTPGPLRVVAAFDADPDAMARALAAGEPVPAALSLPLEVRP